MNAEKNEISQSTSALSDQPSTSSSEFYIDDYSHLRLSYYQPDDTGSTFEPSTDESNTFCKESCDTLETELSVTSIVDAKEAERQKLREYYISQIPDLPHPAYTAASIIASASQRMGGVLLRYNDRIEPGNQVHDAYKEMEFTPKRRSTLKPGEFPNS